MTEYNCRICGLLLDFPPWGTDCNTPTFDFCPCCGVEFGVEDSSYEGAKQYRLEWLRHGAKWTEPNLMPNDWDVAEQLELVLPDKGNLDNALRVLHGSE